MISVKNNRKDYLKKRLCMVNISNRKISEENEITDVILNFNSFFSFLENHYVKKKEVFLSLGQLVLGCRRNINNRKLRTPVYPFHVPDTARARRCQRPITC